MATAQQLVEELKQMGSAAFAQKYGTEGLQTIYQGGYTYTGQPRTTVAAPVTATPTKTATAFSGLGPSAYAKLAEVAPQLVPKGAVVGTDPYKASSPTYVWGETPKPTVPEQPGIGTYTPPAGVGTYTPPPPFDPTKGAQYRTPADFKSLFDAAVEMQKPALEADMQRLLQQLASRGEQRGIWHSGIQTELERRELGDLQRHYALNALNQAMQMAGLSMQEQRDLYDMYARDRDFGRRVFETDRAYDLSLWQARAPYELLTEYQRQTLPLEWTQVVGQVPGGQMEPARSYAESRGASVVWDGARNVVKINGYEVPADWGRRDAQGNLLLPKGILDWVLSLPPKGVS